MHDTSNRGRVTLQAVPVFHTNLIPAEPEKRVQTYLWMRAYLFGRRVGTEDWCADLNAVDTRWKSVQEQWIRDHSDDMVHEVPGLDAILVWC